jgi:hypothetical protein
MRFLVKPVLAAFLAASLSAASPDTKAPARSGTPASQPAVESSVTGTVLETMDSGGYTYMKLKTDTGEIWAAVNQAKVQKGQSVTIASPMMMQNFESRTLHRTFDRILFGTLAGAGAATGAAGGAQAPPPGHPGFGSSGSSMSGGPPATGPIHVTRATGPDGRTIAEIYAQRTALKDKQISVRGKVVKYTPQVMGKNWMHLRDGSGSPEKKNDDITVTTAATAAIGDVVLVRGTVRLDRDLGAGYTYPVLLENATVTK